jgi:hypothetical protein
MMDSSDADDITVQGLQQMSLNERHANRAEKYFAKIQQSKDGDTRACFSLNDNSEHEIVLSSSSLYSLHDYSPEMKVERKHREEQAAALTDGYHCCGCCPDWWEEVEGTLKYTLMSIKQVLNAAFK